VSSEDADHARRVEQAETFAELCDANGLHGLIFQHMSICPRRAWLHFHRIDYAHLEDRMAAGTAAHALSKARDKSVEGLFGLSPDRIDWAEKVVVEAKGKRGAVEAVSRQTFFYALMLTARTKEVWRPALEIIAERRTTPIALTDEAVSTMIALARCCVETMRGSCPQGIDAPICRTCSYQHFCGRS
jgi:CRISPR-associated exonuclease Cas4